MKGNSLSVILSAHLTQYSSVENKYRHELLTSMIYDLGLSYAVVQGVYKGVSEVSILVKLNSFADLEILKNYAFKNFGQESVLFNDYNGMSHLMYNDGKDEMLGKLQPVASIVGLDAYTIVNGQAWAVA